MRCGRASHDRVCQRRQASQVGANPCRRGFTEQGINFQRKIGVVDVVHGGHGF